MGRALIGITCDVSELGGRLRTSCTPGYAEAIARAGGVPVLLSPVIECVAEQVERCDGIVLSGGDDPRTERYGEATDPRVTPLNEVRQAYEEALIEHLNAHAPDKGVLGVCLGMQMMALMAGGKIDQHMPGGRDVEGRHWDGVHRVRRVGDLGVIGDGEVFSRHRQCVVDAGGMVCVAEADDGVMEAIADVGRRFHLGVQWHPERTGGELGDGVFARLVRAAQSTI